MIIDGEDIGSYSEHERMGLMTMILLEDVVSEYGLVRLEPTDGRRRSFIRIMFSSIEAYIYQLRQAILLHVKSLDVATVCLLNEKKYRIRNYEPFADDDFMKFLDAYVFSFQTAIRIVEPTYKIDKSTQEWRNFVTLKEKRDGLMHPKRIEQIIIGEADIALARSVFNWHYRNIEMANYAFAVLHFPNDSVVQSAMHPDNSTISKDLLEEFSILLQETS